MIGWTATATAVTWLTAICKSTPYIIFLTMTINSHSPTPPHNLS